jgi:hypothetical protein
MSTARLELERVKCLPNTTYTWMKRSDHSCQSVLAPSRLCLRAGGPNRVVPRPGHCQPEWGVLALLPTRVPKKARQLSPIQASRNTRNGSGLPTKSRLRRQ